MFKATLRVALRLCLKRLYVSYYVYVEDDFMCRITFMTLQIYVSHYELCHGEFMCRHVLCKYGLLQYHLLCAVSVHIYVLSNYVLGSLTLSLAIEREKLCASPTRENMSAVSSW